MLLLVMCILVRSMDVAGQSVKFTPAGCVLKSTNSTSYFHDGDLILGGIIELLTFPFSRQPDFKAQPQSQECFGLSLRYYRHLLAFVFAVEEINKRQDLLTNVTLGFWIHDSCTIENKALESTLRILSDPQGLVPNFHWLTRGKVAGFIGHLLSSSSTAIAWLAGIYRYPQVPPTKSAFGENG